MESHLLNIISVIFVLLWLACFFGASTIGRGHTAKIRSGKIIDDREEEKAAWQVFRWGFGAGACILVVGLSMSIGSSQLSDLPAWQIVLYLPIVFFLFGAGSGLVMAVGFLLSSSTQKRLVKAMADKDEAAQSQADDPAEAQYDGVANGLLATKAPPDKRSPE